jgi:hypothetical protein
MHQRRKTDRPRSAWAKRAMILLSIVASVLIAATFAGDVLVLTRLQTQSTKACAAALDVRDGVVDILVDARQSGDHSTAAAEFYGKAIARMRLVECQH